MTNKLQQWSEMWLMPFNIDKCSVMHIGYKNNKSDYYLNNTKLHVIEKEKDLGVHVTWDLMSKS